MRDLQPLRPDFDREVDDFRQMVDVLAVDRRIDGEAEPQLPRPQRHVALLGDAAFIGRNAVGGGGIDILNRHLHMVETNFRERLQPLARQQHARK